MFLWATAIALTIIFLFLLLLLWIRKKHFDSIHRNFLSLVNEYGGRVIRNGFAVRPRFNGEIRGDRVSVSINSESGKEGRDYYIAVTMQAQPRANFVIKSRAWLDGKNHHAASEENVVDLQNGDYLLETTGPDQMKMLDLSKIDAKIPELHPFAYLLMGKSAVLLERTSSDLKADTDFDDLRKLVEGVHSLKRLIE